MARNYKDEYNNARRHALQIAKSDEDSKRTTIYLSFTKYGKKVFKDMNKRLYDDAVLDYEIGVISEEEKKVLVDAYQIIENSIAIACVY